MLDAELLYIFGVSTIGVASIAYVLFGFTSSPPNASNAPIRGLKNVKNNCFINAILQAISNCDSMIEWLETADKAARLKGKLIDRVKTLLERINTNDIHSEILNPHEVIQALREYRWVFSNEEQDAYELFHVLISTLKNELNTNAYLNSIRGLFTPNENGLANGFRIHTRVAPQTISSQIRHSSPTGGVLVNQLTCRNCHYKYPLHLESFDALSLILPVNSLQSSITLQHCLANFVCTERIDNFKCDKCSTKTIFDRKVELLKMPRLLCLHLQRAMWANNLTKRVDHVKFPEVLVMDRYAYKAKVHTEISKVEAFNLLEDLKKNCMIDGDRPVILPRHRYILRSVIVHLGGSDSGHFICYRRMIDLQASKVKWYYVSDLVVREVSKSEVFSSSAYMLFYEKYPT